MSSFKYLGVNISEDLTWTAHIQTQVKKAKAKTVPSATAEEIQGLASNPENFLFGDHRKCFDSVCISVWYGNIFITFTFIFTFSHFAFCIYPKLLTIGEYIKRLILKRQTDRGSAPQHQVSGIVQISKYKIAREGEKDKEKDEDIEKGKVFLFLFFMMKSSSVERYEFSVVA